MSETEETRISRQFARLFVGMVFVFLGFVTLPFVQLYLNLRERMSDV